MTLFVTFEGPEGAGKTTQMTRLAATLVARGFDVVVTREPGGTAIGEAIRSVLLTPDHSAMLAATEALLHTAARSQHVAEVIEPALAVGKIVLCDRFVDSTLAYQGAGRGLDTAELLRLQQFALRGVWPDLTLLLDVPVEMGLARRLASGEPLNRLDADEQSFHERVRQGFLTAAAADPGRWRVIDASAPTDVVAEAVFDAVAGRLPAGADLKGH